MQNITCKCDSPDVDVCERESDCFGHWAVTDVSLHHFDDVTQLVLRNFHAATQDESNAKHDQGVSCVRF